jgi:hypothetical protein
MEIQIGDRREETRILKMLKIRLYSVMTFIDTLNDTSGQI